MSWQREVMLIVVSIAAITAAPWNVTAAALVAAWSIAQAYWLRTGDSLPTHIYVICDIAVLGIIYAKPPVWDSGPFRTVWDRVRAFIVEKSISDRIVILIFPVAWVLYVAPIDERTSWLALMALAIAQFVAATAETWFRLFIYYREHRGLGFSIPPPWIFRVAGRKAGAG